MPYLVKLHAEQVQLLSQFTSWMVIDPAGRAELERVMRGVLQASGGRGTLPGIAKDESGWNLPR